MNTVLVNGKNYNLPAWVLEHNANAVDFYKVLNIVEVISGKDDFDRLGDNDFLESDCFGAYAHAKGINSDDAMIHDVAESIFAWITDYDAEDHILVYLESST